MRNAAWSGGTGIPFVLNIKFLLVGSPICACDFEVLAQGMLLINRYRETEGMLGTKMQRFTHMRFGNGLFLFFFIGFSPPFHFLVQFELM